MAYKINSDCNNCGACEPECPNNAISVGENIFEINPELCTECVGFHGKPQCAVVCPVDACLTDENQVETEEVLISKLKKIHPEKDYSGTIVSHFKK
ncbi:MAG: 4Fe-4S ferredoxin [Bdellovibrionales bacterium RBG_16_40_8]|nr:MAG: 4Fe-4S ferredoxin [Bdellovibrionales bacterium RBG_16_40_8]